MNQENRQSRLLLDHVTPALYERSAFRILSLPVEATGREIRRRLEQLELDAGLADPEWERGLLRPLLPHGESFSAPQVLPMEPPELEDARDAARRLQDPEIRVLEEVFWFWPPAGGADEAWEVLQRGDAEEAERLWLLQLQQDPADLRATHNLAVLHHLWALDLEKKRTKNGFISGQLTLDRYWHSAIQRWQEVIARDDCWAHIEARALALDDPRLTGETMAQWRRVLPQALLQIHTALAQEASEQGRRQDVQRQLQLLESWRMDPADRRAVREQAIHPVRSRIRTLVQVAHRESEQDPVHADQTVLHLLDSDPVQAGLHLLDVLLGTEHPERMALRDEVADGIREMIQQYVIRTEGYATAIGLLQRARQVAAGRETVARLDETIEELGKRQQEGPAWYGPGYHALPAPLLDRLEEARKQAEGLQWSEAVAILDRLYHDLQYARHHGLIAIPLALCLHARAHTRMNQAMAADSWGKTRISPAVARRTLQEAEKDLARACELVPGNRMYLDSHQNVVSALRKVGGRPSRSPSSSADRSTVAVKQQSVAGAQKEPPPTKSGSPLGVLLMVSIVFGIPFVLSQCLITQPAPVRAPTAVPNPTSVSVPTRTDSETSSLPSVKTTASNPGCVSWQQVDLGDVGREMCVFGDVQEVRYTDEAMFITFSNDPTDFYLLSYEKDRVYEGLGYGSCIQIQETIEKLGQTPVYQVRYNDSLYHCP